MNFLKKRYTRIKNLPSFRLEKDFIFNTFSLLVLIILAVAAVAVFELAGLGLSDLEIQGITMAVIISGLIIALVSIWNMLLFALLAGWIVLFYLSSSTEPLAYLIPALSLMLSSTTQLMYHWDKAVILRFGKFKRVQEAGIFFLIPFVDRIAHKVDTRIRVTDFSAERTLSMDNVPVHIDAICFWMIWDPEKAILEVENFLEAVTLSAQTALRDSIGSHDLNTLLSRRDEVGRELQRILDAKTNPWGITVLSVEFTDIIIPKELEDIMSRKAQAYREKQAREILGDAEISVAEKMTTANEFYRNNPQAFQLRAMNMVYDGLRQSKGSIMLMPSSAIESMDLGSPAGLAALQKMQNQTREDGDVEKPLKQGEESGSD
ncbi:MAG: SPFH domain-containing protein [Spirochaetaceae bacterium]